MCFDDDSHPPMPLSENSGAHGEDMTITAADGTAVLTYVAEPGDKPTSQVVILPDVRGLHNFYRELALRFADVGMRALVVDYFGRTAPDTNRDSSFEYGPHVQQMTQETFGQDLSAAVEAIRQGPGVRLNTFTVGFCMGGSLSLWAGTCGLGLTGVIAFYASLSRTMGAVTPALDFANRIECPVLGLFGGADQAIPVEQVKEFEQKLNEAGIPNEIVIYPGAPHSFFDRKAEEFATASADAWTRVQGFIGGFQPAMV